MSQPANPAHTPANSTVRNTAGKGSKQTPDNNSGCLPADKLREICEKHYNQILPIMAEKVHQEKLQGLQTRLTYGESSHRNSQTQFSESESCDRKKRPKKRRQSPVTASRGTRPSQTASVFSRLRHERDKPTRRRSPVSATVFTRLGPGDKNVFTRSAETPSQRRKDARELIRSYVTCSSKRQQEIEEEWNTADRASRKPYTRTEEPYYSENDHDQGGRWKSKKRRVWSDKLPPESIDNYEMLRKAFLGNYSQQKKYIKDPVEIYHIKQREGESTEALIERFKAENEMMSITIAFLRGEVAAANQSKKKAPLAWKHHENGHRPNFDKRLDFKSQHKSSRRQDHFTPLTKTPKEILAMDTVKFKASPPMTGHAENGNKNKFREFHGDKGHSTDDAFI
ncbi:hypothetical protein Tco_0534401 [Tanacetum coccineum]